MTASAWKTLRDSALLFLLAAMTGEVSGHARLMEPPSRSSMWRVGFPTKRNYNDNALYCGGMQIQWSKNGGNCGICGDPWQMPHPRENEAGGAYGRGIITRRYKAGEVIEASVDVTTNHKGYFEFRICPNNNPRREATQKCLDSHTLQLANGRGTRFYIENLGSGDIRVHLRLPKGLTCTQCVFQWTYVAGNNWGRCEDGTGRLGCGPQETFRGCSDIAITGTNGASGGGEDDNAIEVSNPEENDVGGQPPRTSKPRQLKPILPDGGSRRHFSSFPPSSSNKPPINPWISRPAVSRWHERGREPSGRENELDAKRRVTNSFINPFLGKTFSSFNKDKMGKRDPRWTFIPLSGS